MGGGSSTTPPSLSRPLRRYSRRCLLTRLCTARLVTTAGEEHVIGNYGIRLLTYPSIRCSKRTAWIFGRGRFLILSITTRLRTKPSPHSKNPPLSNTHPPTSP